METELKNHIAAVIRAARKANNLTQEELAALIERTPESLSNLERGQAVPSIETLVSLCQVLKIEASTILDFQLPDSNRTAAEHRMMQEVQQIVSRLDKASLALAKVQLEAILDFQNRS